MEFIIYFFLISTPVAQSTVLEYCVEYTMGTGSSLLTSVETLLRKCSHCPGGLSGIRVTPGACSLYGEHRDISPNRADQHALCLSSLISSVLPPLQPLRMTVPWSGLSLTNSPQEPEGQILYPQLDLSVPALDILIWGLHPGPYFLPDRPATLLEAVSRPHLLGSGRDA